MKNIKNAADCIDLNDKNNISKIEYNLRIKGYKLNELVKIFNSDNSDFSKTMEMIKIYDKVENLVKAYNYYFTKQRKIPDYLECNKNEYFLIVDFYKKMEEKGILTRAKYLTFILPFLVNYEYSKNIIDDFIKYDGFELEDFLENRNITSEDFMNIINVISVLDKVTYNNYLNKCEMNDRLRYNYYCETIKNLYFGIKNGFLLNGEKFNILVFLKCIPFKLDFKRTLLKFVKEYLPNCYDTILNYMIQNGLLDDRKRMAIDKSFIANGTSIINGRFISNEENKLIYNYIIENGLPDYSIVFNIVRDMYINGEISLDSNIKKVKTVNN